VTHGTTAAYWRHKRANEPVCTECRDSFNEQQRLRRAEKPKPRPADFKKTVTTAMDKLIAEDPPVIQWVLDKRRRVMVAARIHDPHAEGPISAARQQLVDHAKKRAVQPRDTDLLAAARTEI